MIYLVAPVVTNCGLAGADRFCYACNASLSRHVLTSLVNSAAAVPLVSAGEQDAAVFFNPGDGVALSAAVTRMLQQTGRVFPVAMTSSARRPPAVAATRQSFDVAEYLALRGGERNIGAAGAAFAREVLSVVQPTLSRSRLALFLSHRRADGEDLARRFWEHLLVLKQDEFRDLADLAIGDDAQRVIELRLRESDAVLFFDSPLASTSEWVGRELRIALRSGIPIVWIKAGDHTLPNGFPQPARYPHFTLGGPEVTREDAERAVSVASNLVRESAVQVLEARSRLKDLGGVEVVVKDPDRLVYTVRIQCGKALPYPQECTTHLVQFFGVRPRDADAEKFLKFPGEYTARLLLVRGEEPPQFNSGNDPIAARADDYVDHLEDYLRAPSSRPARRGLIVSGAFSDDCTPNEQQDVIDAVRAFAGRALDRGGTVIFGAHPTFEPLIFDVARQKRPDDFRDAVRLYFSEYFVKNPSPFEGRATLVPTPDTGERNSSLSLMRWQMIHDENAAGVVAIGGRRPRPGIPPGVDEEVALAREAGLPAFLIGSVQGRSAELAAAASSEGWKNAPNHLTPEENDRLRTSLDFAGLASLVLRHLGI
jgi:hypothetical protein